MPEAPEYIGSGEKMRQALAARLTPLGLELACPRCEETHVAVTIGAGGVLYEVTCGRCGHVELFSQELPLFADYGALETLTEAVQKGAMTAEEARERAPARAPLPAKVPPELDRRVCFVCQHPFASKYALYAHFRVKHGDVHPLEQRDYDAWFESLSTEGGPGDLPCASCGNAQVNEQQAAFHRLFACPSRPPLAKNVSTGVFIDFMGEYVTSLAASELVEATTRCATARSRESV